MFTPLRRAGLGLVMLVAMATSAFAQASIAGAVTDTSGAVLPGVTVEVSSPALIEGARSVVTDGSGLFRVVDLRPGMYLVVFSLPGFNTVRREGIELSGSFVATVNAEMRVGAVEETVTVTGETPVVDVQSTRTETRISSEVIAAIPTGRQYFSLTRLAPNVSTQGVDVGGSTGPSFSVFRSRGGTSDDGLLYVNGFPTGYMGLGVSYYVSDLGAAEEVAMTSGGGLAENRVGGPIVNVVPRQGGNTFRGSIYANGAGSALESSNFTSEHQAAGLRAPNRLKKIWDVNTYFGGPIRRDRVWFFTSFRDQGNRKLVAGMWANRNAGDPTKWTYDADFGRQATETGRWTNGTARLTSQLSSSNRVSVFWDEQKICRLCLGGEGSPTASPEATSTNEGFPQRHVQATWTSPVTNRLLLDGGVSLNYTQYGGVPKEADTRQLIRATELGGQIPGITYRSTNWSRPAGTTVTWRFAMAFITGTHSFKAGYEGNRDRDLAVNFTNDHLLSYTLLNGLPTQLTMTLANGIRNLSNARHDAFYVQNQWTRRRLTLQGGLRYEHVTSSYPEQHIPASQFNQVALVFPEQDSPINLHDLTPRIGMTYDLFGNGRTAVRASLGRYLGEPAGAWNYSRPYNPLSRVVTSTNRSWRDNGNFVPDCDLLNPVANGVNGDLCGAWSNANFGRSVFSTSFDDDLVTGWNHRLYNWDFATAVRHQLVERVGVEVEYMHRWFGNFRVIDNLATGLADFDQFTLVAPLDDRLPDSGGYTIGPLYNVKPEKFGQTNNIVRLSSAYGDKTRRYDGVTVNATARLRQGLTAQGGFNTGRTTEDFCDIRQQDPDITVTNIGGQVQWGGLLDPFCHVSTPMQTSVSGLVSYTIPRIDLQVSGTLSSRPSIDGRDSSQTLVPNESLKANNVFTNAQIRPSLGRDLSGGAQTLTVNLVEHGTVYTDRITTVDFRVAKVQRFGIRRLMVGLDLYNIFNADTVIAVNQTYGARWLSPQGIVQARFAKLSAQFDF